MASNWMVLMGFIDPNATKHNGFKSISKVRQFLFPNSTPLAATQANNVAHAQLPTWFVCVS